MGTAARDRLAKLLGGGAQAASSMQLHAPVGDVRHRGPGRFRDSAHPLARAGREARRGRLTACRVARSVREHPVR
jgi:hypothetical protein